MALQHFMSKLGAGMSKIMIIALFVAQPATAEPTDSQNEPDRAELKTLVPSANTNEHQHSNEEHPAVLVGRAAAKQGYRYPDRIYPHPAELKLSSGPR